MPRATGSVCARAPLCVCWCQSHALRATCDSCAGDAVNEIRVLASIRHPHVVGFYDAFLANRDHELWVVMELCACGDLSSKVDRYRSPFGVPWRLREGEEKETALFSSLESARVVFQLLLLRRKRRRRRRRECFQERRSCRLSLSAARERVVGLLQASVASTWTSVWCGLT